MVLKVEIELEPIESVRKKILALPKKLERALLNIVEEIVKHMVMRSRLNAPIKEGDLRGSIKYEKPRILSSGVIVTALGSDLPYALRWHEEPFNLGKVSAAQPSTPEGGVGNKYITRAIEYRSKKYAEIIMDAVLYALEYDTNKPKIKIEKAD